MAQENPRPTAPTLEEQLSELRDKITALESKPHNSVTADDLKSALNDHPDFKRIHAFLDKWGDK
jgi:hypothetical protein